jgi:hypothetical protein
MPAPEYWQIAAGDEGRNYAAYFLDHGMAFVGGDRNIRRIPSLKAGDKLLLKRGTGAIIAVGEVIERDGRTSGNAVDDADPNRQWLLDFDGWELPAWCHVRWHKLARELAVGGLTRGTIRRCPQSHLRELADKLLAELPPHEGAPGALPRTEPVGDTDLLRHLVGRGLRVGAAEELTEQLRRIRLLADYYYSLDDWSSVREHETRTFLVAPFLLALGWAEQQIKIELKCSGGKVDMACFRDPFTGAATDEAVMLIETKGLSQGLDLARIQAEQYARDFPTCNLLLVTNGLFYKAYSRIDNEKFTTAPTAYLNLRRPTRRYPLNPSEVAGALDAVELLLPNVAARQRPGRPADVQGVA